MRFLADVKSKCGKMDKASTCIDYLVRPTSASILLICGAKRASSVSAFSWVQYEDLEMFQSVRTCMAVHGAVLPGMGPAAADSQRGEHAEVSF